MTTDATTTLLAVGAPAPDLPVTVDPETTIQLSQLWASKPLVLAFFGAMNNPFTQDNAAQLRDGHAAIQRAGANLAVAVSLAPEAANAFEDRWALPYPLVSDEHRAIATAFGVDGSACFVIDALGVVRFARAAANLADYPPVTMLLHPVCDITGAERPKAEDDTPLEPAELLEVMPTDPTLDAKYRPYRCPKCGGTNAEHKDISTSGGTMSRFFDFQGHRFVATSCVACGYTELYRRKSGRASNALDILGSG
jgi:predicted nucleic-acid-binding Zn-ribbon protein/peroxiredoxin